jgi:hypothetical protein
MSKAKQEAENGSASSDGTPTLTKRETVRRALAELGPAAKPGEIQAFLREKYHLEMSSNMVSSYKSQLIKKAGGLKKKRGRKSKPARSELAPRAETTDGVSLKDLHAIKELANRLGVGKLRALIDLLAH